MDRNDTTVSPTQGEPISEGVAVFDAGGHKVGTVVAHDRAAGIVVVEKGWIWPRDFAVPLSAIARTDETGVYLTLHKDELLYDFKDDLTTMNWDPPDQRETGTPTAQHEHVIMGSIPVSGAEPGTALANAVVERVVEVPLPGEEARLGTRTPVVEELRLLPDAGRGRTDTPSLRAKG